MVEVNFYVSLFRQFSAETAGGRSESQIIQLRRMQPVRESLNILAEVGNTLLRRLHVLVKLPLRRRLLVPIVQFDSQQGKTLIDVVVKLSADPGPLFFVSFN